MARKEGSDRWARSHRSLHRDTYYDSISPVPVQACRILHDALQNFVWPLPSSGQLLPALPPRIITASVLSSI